MFVWAGAPGTSMWTWERFPFTAPDHVLEGEHNGKQIPEAVLKPVDLVVLLKILSRAVLAP